ERLVAFALHECRVTRFEQLEDGRHVPRVVAKLECDPRAFGHLVEESRERGFVAARVRRKLDEQRAETRGQVRERAKQEFELLVAIAQSLDVRDSPWNFDCKAKRIRYLGPPALDRRRVR